MEVRAFYTATDVAGQPAPWDTIQLKVYYPASFGNSAEERNMGFIPADSSAAPYPVAVLIPGSNCSPESYSWLAMGLAAQGRVCVVYSWIKEDMPGYVSLSPGFDLAALTPEHYGSAPSCSALPSVLGALEKLNDEGLLKGLLDLSNVFLGGHSAGGNAVLLNTHREWFPQLAGGFCYAAHSGASTQIGFPPNTLLPLPGSLPLLIMGGNCDGVIAASASRYGDDQDSSPCQRIEQTFHQALNRSEGDSHLLIVDGANHFCFTEPYDGATGRAFLDWPAKHEQAALREFMLGAIDQFISAVVSGEPDQHQALAQHCQHHPDFVAQHHCK